ncbi:MAG: flagellar hook-length control protein FliK [Paracoccus sp. (in: a-proteobacteria)]|nr:flagellar hook-length control protein FliK [Paracoccus sp. (in: a-proteobacteria)]
MAENDSIIATAGDANDLPDLSADGRGNDALQDWLVGFNGISAETAGDLDRAEPWTGQPAHTADMQEKGRTNRASAALAAAEAEPSERFLGRGELSAEGEGQGSAMPVNLHRDDPAAAAAVRVSRENPQAPSETSLRPPILKSARLGGLTKDAVRLDPADALAGPSQAIESSGTPVEGKTAAVRMMMALVSKQVSEAVLISRPGTTELQLAPVELGRLRITVTGTDHLQIAIWAERPETGELLRRHVDLLQAELLQAGAAPEALIFQDDPSHGETSDNGQRIAESLGDAPAPSPDRLDALALESARLAANRRLDLRL